MDRLQWILKYFNLHACVFQAGPLCHSANFADEEGYGYIHVLRQGKLEVTSAGQSFVLDRPSLFFYMNPTSHCLQPLSDDVDMVCASFDFGMGMRNPIAQALPDVIKLSLEDAPLLSTVLQLLFSESRATQCGKQATLDRLIEIVIIQLLRILMEEGRLQTGLLAGLADPRLAKAITAMHEKPSYAWTLQELASTAGMSRSRFALKFRHTVGTTAGNYLTEWRIGIAQSLLQRGKSLQIISDTVGYSNTSALSRAFTSVTGIAPTEWKQKYLTDGEGVTVAS